PLPDHPHAPALSPRRRRLMRAAARWGLDRIVCVSSAVRRECIAVGYPAARLAVVRNGLPDTPAPPGPRGEPSPPRLGFLGTFSERKGMRGLIEMASRPATGARESEVRIGCRARRVP